ncbi:MAG TPA: DUF5017 domain-containing protein, partial [Sphingobacteriaceae bacterium]
LAACDKDVQVDEAPDFDVTTESTTYKAGDQIKFQFKGGDANQIYFYSGETLKDYNSKDGRIIDVSGAGATMQFSSSVQVGSQANQLSLHYSTDFNGDYSSLAKVKAATWTDITSKFKLGTSTAFLATGAIDISDLIVPGKPIYFAFKYVTKPQATNGLARQWFIQSFAINSKALLDNSIALNIADQASVGFRIIDENAVNAPARSSVSSTRLTMYGNEYLHAGLPQFDPNNPIFDKLNPIYNPNDPAYTGAKYVPFVPFDPNSPYNDPLSEHWAVSKPITIDQVNLGPDRSTAIKGVTSSAAEEFRYTYAKPGTYKAVFVAANSSIDDIKQVVKEITLTITP